MSGPKFDFTPRCERVCSAPQGSTTFRSTEAYELPNPALAVWVGSGDSAGRGLQTLRFSMTTEGGREHNELAAIVLL